MTSAAPARRRGIPNVSQGTFDAVFGYVYAFVMTNLMLVAANLPLVFFVFVVADPIASWPFFLVLSVTVAPSIAAAFGVFLAERSEHGAPVRAFWASYRASFVRASLLGLVCLAVLAVCGADLVFVAGTSLAPFAGPFFAVLGVVAVAVTTTALVGLALYPRARFPGVTPRVLLATAFYVTVRRWYFSVLSVVCLGAVVAFVLVQPLLGAVLAPSILLFVVWSNTHFAFAAAAADESAR